MDDGALVAATEEFEAARARGAYFPNAWFDRLSLDDAYRIQLALIRRRQGARRLRIGHADQERAVTEEPDLAHRHRARHARAGASTSMPASASSRRTAVAIATAPGESP